MTILYHAEPRLYSLKPLIALEEKGVIYERRPIGTAPIERAVPGYPAGIDQQISIEGEGPVLLDAGKMINSSFFILEYIAEAFDGPALLPDAPLDRFRTQAVGQLVANMVAPFLSAIALARYPLREVVLAGIEPVERRWAWERAASGDTGHIEVYAEKLRPTIAKLEAMLEAGPWFAGDYSIADIDVYAMLCDLPDLAPGLIATDGRLADFLARVASRPAVVNAHGLGWGTGAPAYLPGPEISRWG